MGDKVTLFHWEPNANSGKPMLALAEKGVPFESHYLDLLNFDQHKPDYLEINPQGTIPAMIHGDRVLTESTAIMEYADAAFDGPALMPEDPRDRWRVRWWMKFMDQWLAPSFSMIGWSIFVGPSVRARDPAELEAAIDRDEYSLADVNGFNLAYALPLSQPDLANDEKTPHIMEWLRKIYERPATRQIWAMGRTPMVARVKILEREPQA